MKNKPLKSLRRTACAIIASSGFAAAAPDHGLPLPEDPVVLPTEEETAQFIRNIRESELKQLKWDADGWDDIWVMVQKSHDKNYKFDPNDKTKDTDGDGMSDYEEMLTHRSATYKEPNYTNEQLIEQVRESRRQAIVNLKNAEERWQRDLAAARPHLRELLPPGHFASVKDEAAADTTAGALRAAAARSRLERANKERQLDALASRLGTERILYDQRGRKQVLSGEFMGEPLYNAANDTLSAAGISADELWPMQNNAGLPGFWPWTYAESSTGLGLSGLGQTLALWEVDGGVLSTHIEFGTTRVFQKDSAPVDATGHASNVAGTMAATGTGTLGGTFYESRGVAYRANVFAYESNTSFKSEREGAAAGNATDPPVRASNHSWGKICGWRKEDIDATAAVNEQWVWWGPTQTNFQEDVKFGFYLPDQTSTDDGCTQIDLFLQSQAPQHLMVYSCGNDRAEGPATSPGTYYTKSGSVYTAVSAATTPRDWDDGDAGFYDTVAPPGTAKNVLTVGACEDVYFPANPAPGATVTIGFGPNANATPATYSGAGPTDDGRIKPDVVAVGSPATALILGTAPNQNSLRSALGLTAVLPGNPAAQPVISAPSAAGTGQYTQGITGTSFAAPAVTGSLGLVMERRQQLYPTLPASQTWRGSTLKGIAIATCDDIGTEGPDYRMGYGIVNARSEVLLVNQDNTLGRGSLIKEFSLAPNTAVSWVVVSNGTTPLCVTVPWSDPPGPALTSVSAADPQNAMLINNIDVKVERIQTGTVFLPWILNPDLTGKSSTVRGQAATRGLDNRNNVEKVSIAAPAAGRYRITVTHSGGIAGAATTQVVSAILNGVTPELPTITGLAKSPTAGQFMLTFTADPGAFFTIQTSVNLSSWTNVGSVLAEQVTNSVVVTTGTTEPKRYWRLKRGQ